MSSTGPRLPDIRGGLSNWICVVLLAILAAPALWSQTGELRLRVTDSQGLALPGSVTIVSESTEVRISLPTDAAGRLTVRHLPCATYLVTAAHPGFAPASRMVELRSALPVMVTVALHPSAAATSIVVNGSQTLLARDEPGNVNRIGRAQIRNRPAALPGRGLIQLVNSQPGWLFEGNAVLHPRGSEYQTQFVVNGIPLIENRSPGFGSQLEAADIQSLAIYTAGIPAEYGRDLGGVVEVNTLSDIRKGLHGETTLSGGSFSTADGYASASYGWGANSASASADGATTGWYENPPVLQNYTNTATTGDAAGSFERQFSTSDRLTATIRHAFARFLVPNEQVQQSAGQRQHRATLETMGSAAWQHILSPAALVRAAGMMRDDSALLDSNALSTPIVAAQNRGFREQYLKATAIRDWHSQEFKAGVEGDFLHLREAFSYSITDPSQFDPGTPGSFQFAASKLDSNEGAFIEDTARIGRWTLAPGLRWDNYSLVVHRSAFSPRLAVSRYFARADLTAHFSLDHVFEPPAFENLLLSSSPQVVSLDAKVLRKPVLPSTGNYYEAGISKAVRSTLRVDANLWLRRFRNFADDNPLLDTSISFPIAFARASIYGAEGKLTLPQWGRFSGYLSYSYMVASCDLPVTGGLFLGDQATQALNQLSGRLWVSQDQRNTVRTRWMARLPRGFRIASGLSFGSGLPVDFDGTRAQALQQYGAPLVDRVNFARGRLDPNLSVSAMAARSWSLGDRARLRVEAGGENLTNRINLIDFAGLFSGNAVAPARSGNFSLSIRF